MVPDTKKMGKIRIHVGIGSSYSSNERKYLWSLKRFRGCFFLTAAQRVPSISPPALVVVAAATTSAVDEQEDYDEEKKSHAWIESNLNSILSGVVRRKKNFTWHEKRNKTHTRPYFAYWMISFDNILLWTIQFSKFQRRHQQKNSPSVSIVACG